MNKTQFHESILNNSQLAKVYILCGKICSGKSTYSQQLRKDKKADAYFVDEGLAEKFKPILKSLGKKKLMFGLNSKR